jgi:hypothetical protein
MTFPCPNSGSHCALIAEAGMTNQFWQGRLLGIARHRGMKPPAIFDLYQQVADIISPARDLTDAEINALATYLFRRPKAAFRTQRTSRSP